MMLSDATVQPAIAGFDGYRYVPWQHQAIMIYHNRHDVQARQFAQTLGDLTGCTIDPQAIFVGDAGAYLRLDGVLFQYAQEALTVIRPCAACGFGRFVSPPIHNLVDLGYALSGWQPICIHCTPDD